MTNKYYKISIIVPIYNVEIYIKRCIDSLLNQTYKNIEIILIDDGSTDNSGKICDKYKYLDKRIKVLHKTNQGQSSARNLGIKNITGELIMFVDADDWLDYNCIEACVKEFYLDSSLDCVMFPYIREFENISKKVKVFGEKRIIFNNNDTKKIYRRFWGLIGEETKKPDSLNDITAPWGKMYFSKFLKDIYFIDNKKIGSSEDTYFNMNVFLKIKKIIYISNVYYHYNKVNQISTVNTFRKNIFETKKFFYYCANELINKYSLSKDFKIALNNRMIFDLLGISRNIMLSKETFFCKYNLLKELLGEKYIKKAFERFDFKYLDMKWKIYYFFCKKSVVIGVMLMTMLAEKLKKYLR